MRKRILIGAGVALFVVIVVAILAGNRTRRTEVEAATVGRKHLVATVSASGTIDPKRSVDVSANTMGRVVRLAVAEGDTVQAGDFLLEIDPTEFRSVVSSLEAAVRTSEANLRLAQASLEKAKLDLRRAEQLNDEGLATEEQLQAARTTAEVEEARVAAARSTLVQQQANLDKARYDLEKVTVTAPMTGIVTRLNVEEGENAIMGTLNNPGTVLLTIADLSRMEARVRVDETEVVKLAFGQPARIEIDAFPDTSFQGRVTEIGNSPIYSSAGASQQAVDFEVKVTLEDRIPTIRPGLSAEAEIRYAERDSALAVPLGAVTVRRWPPEPRVGRRNRRAAAQGGEAERSGPEAGAVADSAGIGGAAAGAEPERKDREGVFVIEDGVARFRPIRLGITGEEDFEVLSGLAGGERIVSGPFRVLRDLQDGDEVEVDEGRGRRGRRGRNGDGDQGRD